MVVDNEFDIFDVVYLRTDPDQLQRMVASIEIRANNLLSYGLACGTEVTYHYAEEISTERTVML